MSKQKKNGLMKAIWLITLVPLVIAWIMAYTGAGLPDDTKNNGILMPSGLSVPQSLIDEQDGRWGLVVVSDKCDVTCQQQVYRLQQLFISLEKHQERLHAVWLSNDPQFDTTTMQVDLAQDKVQILNDETAFNWFQSQELDWQDQSIWLVDPLGTLVLRFTPELSGREMMSDIQWLLKASRIG